MYFLTEKKRALDFWDVFLEVENLVSLARAQFFSALKRSI